MRRLSDQGRITREKLLATTEATLSERGWEATTVQAIQRRAGISQGSWSHAFPDGKVQAAAEIYDAIHREVWPGVLEPFKSGGRKDAVAVLGQSLGKLFAYASERGPRLRLYVSLEQVPLQAERGDFVRAHQAEIEQALVTWADKVLDAPRDDGGDLGRLLRPILFGASLAMVHGGTAEMAMVPPNKLVDALAAAAWTCVRQLGGQKPPAKSPKPTLPPPTKGMKQPTLL